MRRRSTVGSTASAGSPAIRTAPPVGLRRRFTSFNVVVLPAPLRPSRTSVSPAPTENDIPSIRSFPFPGKRYRKSFTSSTMATGRLIYLCCSSMTQPGAPTPLGMSDFFALEAGEYLDRLDALLQPTAPPAAEELVRLARALRGSALMASQQGIARAAMGFEAFARGVREGRRPWDAATKQIAIRSVDDLKIFVRKAASWSGADTAKAEALASQLEQYGGRPSAHVRAAEAIGLDAGARAFVAREGAAIASALDRAGRALRANPIAHDPLQQVLKALQPLRGLAALNDLPPLPDLLEGIEQAIGAISRTTGAPPAGGATGGTGGTGESARPSTLSRLALVSHGEHLRQAADSLERAPSATQRELRAHTLGTTFRALANEGGGVLADRVAQFAIAGREAVASGIAVSSAAAFAAELRRAGDLLVRSGTGDEEALATELDALTAALRAIQPGAAPAPAPPRAPAAPAPAPRPTPASRPTPPRAAAPVVPGVKSAPAPR